MSITEDIAAYVVESAIDDLPKDVRHETRRIVLNIAGCMAGGASHPMTRALLAATGGFCGQGLATGVALSRRLDPLGAALLNGASSSVHAFDDAHEDAIIHPGGPVTAAALALAEQRGASGEAVLLAIALGVEITCRLGRALTREQGSERLGWSLTGIAGGIGAATACAKLIGLDAAATRTAIGIAASQASGFRATHGTMATALLTGHGAQTGLRAALLAEAGMSGPQDVFDHRFGYFAQFGPGADPTALTSGLGSDYALRAIVYKLYPCGIVAYPAVDAALLVSREPGLVADRIETVTVAVSRNAYQLCNRPSPKDPFELQLSLQHWVAAALAHGRVTLANAVADGAEEPAIVSMRDRIAVALDETLAPDGARIAVRLTDGTVLTRQSQGLRGGPRLPLTDAELEDKFRGQAAGPLGNDGAVRAIGLLWKFDAEQNLAGVMQTLSGNVSTD